MTAGTPSSALRWPAEAVWEALAPLWPGFTVEVLPELDSTNSELMRRARDGRADPLLLVTERQTAGRGRLGRSWHAEPGDALTFSLGLPLAPATWSGLSLAVGVALADSLHPDIRLKWPNDLWLDGRKLAGVLIETASVGALRYTVVGVGINLAPCTAPDLALPAAGLRECLPGADAPATLLRVMPALMQALLQFQAQGFAPFQARFRARDALWRQPLVLSDGRSGVGGGVADDGTLWLDTPGGRVPVSSAEVSVRLGGG